VKISIFSIPEISLGKYSIKDGRLDQVDKVSKAKKKTYIQVELVALDATLDVDAILTLKDSRADLILKDLEFIETRLDRTQEDSEKILLNKLKGILEKEEFIFAAGLPEEEKRMISGYSLFTNKPIIVAEKQEVDNLDSLLARTVRETGFISFFTTGEKETRAWLVRKGTTAWEAAGVVHSDIQRGFIRAEIISFEDFMQCGGENQAKQAGKQRLEQKDYIMQDADLVNFRFNK
jgi:ribosome-binding ATPase YchF (GTP1/OBG family)